MTIYLRSVGALLTQCLLGLRKSSCCQGCGFKARGPRHLDAHIRLHCDIEHAGDDPLPSCTCHPRVTP